MSACPYCGRPDDRPVPTVSRHATGSGATVWARCPCGSLQVRQQTAHGVTVTARGRPPRTANTAPCEGSREDSRH